MPVNIYPSTLGAVGIVKESAYGSGGAPAMLIPAAVTPVERLGLQEDTSWRGSAVASYSHQIATLDSTIGLTGPVYPDSIGYLLAGVLGDVAFAAGTPNTWTMAVLNSGAQQPPSYCVVLNDPVQQLSFPGCVVSSLSIAFDPNGLLTYQASLAGMGASTTSAAMPAQSAEKPTAGWVGVVTIGGSVDATVMSGQITFARGVVAKRNVTGMIAPLLMRAELLAVTGSLLLVCSSDAYRALAAAGTATTMDFNFSTGAGAAARQLRVHCSDVTLTSAPRSYGAKWIELPVTFMADANPTDVGASGGQSPVKVTLTNAVASGTYK